MGVDAARVAAWLGAGSTGEGHQTYASWVAELADLEPARERDPGPWTGSDLRTVLIERLGFTTADADEVLATRPDPDEHPELCWLKKRCRLQLVAGMGRVEEARWGAPHLPSELGAVGRFFYVHVLLDALPDALAYHEQRRIPSDISWATFADLGRQVAIHRRIYGRGGLDVQRWFGLHFRGLIYDFGRLQFNRALAPCDRVDGQPWPFEPGAYVLGAHIPESGPMPPEACDESFRRAKDFYATYFPEETYRFATCQSWLLDDQLAEYLPAESNIMRFQRRFTLVPEAAQERDRDIHQFVLRMVEPRLEDIPRRTTLERAIARHREAGRHFRVGSGWVEL